MVILSDEELNQRCPTTKGIHGCTLGVVHQNAPSCEADILAGIEPNESIQCRHQIKVMDPLVETVIQSDRNIFDWYVPTPTTLVVDCEEEKSDKNGTLVRKPQTTVLKGLSRLTIPHRCRAHTRSISASGIDPLVTIHIDAMEAIPQTVFQELVDNIQLPSPTAWNNFSETIRKLRAEGDDPSLQQLLDNVEHNLIFPKNLTDSLPADFTLIILIFITIIILITFIIYCVRQSSCTGKCPIVTMPKKVTLPDAPPLYARRFLKPVPSVPS